MSRFVLRCLPILLALCASPAALLAQPVVAGAAADRTLSWRLEKRWSVGGVSDPILELSHVFPQHIASDARGNLWVLAAQNHRLVEFDRSGKHLRTLGRKGKGPGEFVFPLSVSVAQDGSIRVEDADRELLVRFTADGTVLPEERQPAPALQQLRILANGTTMGIRLAGDSTFLDSRRAAKTHTVARFAEPKAVEIPKICSLSEYNARPVFRDVFAWTTQGNTIAYTSGDFRITLFDGDKVNRVLTRNTPRRPASAALAIRHLGKGARVQIGPKHECFIPPDRIVKAAGFAKRLPAYEALAIAPDGRIWATRYAIGKDARQADVYNPVTGYEGTVPLGSKRPVTFLADGSLVSLEADEDEVPIVVVYRITR